MKKIGLVIINNNRVLRESITGILDQQPGLKVIATFGQSKTSLSKVCDLKPDVLLLDLSSPNDNSLLFMKSLVKKYPALKVIVMDIVPIQEDILQYVEAGVSGFILEDATSDDIILTIQSVADENKVLPHILTGALFSQIIENDIHPIETSNLIRNIRMTNREREMVLFLADGLTNKEIARKLHLSLFKVKKYVQTIFEKMVLNIRIQQAIYSSSK